MLAGGMPSTGLSGSSMPYLSVCGCVLKTYVDGGRILILAAITGAWCAQAQRRAGGERACRSSVEGASRGTTTVQYWPSQTLRWAEDGMTCSGFRTRSLPPARGCGGRTAASSPLDGYGREGRKRAARRVVEVGRRCSSAWRASSHLDAAVVYKPRLANATGAPKLARDSGPNCARQRRCARPAGCLCVLGSGWTLGCQGNNR